jgi:glycosyltransferase 2 family protein
LQILTSRWFRLAVSLALLAAVIWIADWGSIADVMREIEPGWVAFATLLAVLDRLIINLRWQVFLKARGLLVGYGRLLRIQLAANFLGSFLPSSLGVDAVRIAALVRHQLPAAEVVATTLVDRATLVLATLLFGATMVLALAGTRLPDDVRWLILTMTVVLVAGCAAMFHPSVRRWVRQDIVPRLPERIRELTHGVGAATVAYRHETGRMAWAAVLTGVLFGVRIMFAYALARACGAEVTIAELLLVIPILWIVVMVPVTVGGIGLQDAGYVALMALIGVTPAIAFSMSIIEHVVARAVSLPGALFLGDVTGRSAKTVTPP